MSFLGPIGLLNKRLTIEQVSTVPDATGQPIETWSPLMTVWGRVMPQRGGERFIAHQTIGRAVSTIRIRYRSGLTIDTTRISAKIEQGLLTLHLPRQERVKPRKIQVND